MLDLATGTIFWHDLLGTLGKVLDSYFSESGTTEYGKMEIVLADGLVVNASAKVGAISLHNRYANDKMKKVKKEIVISGDDKILKIYASEWQIKRHIKDDPRGVKVNLKKVSLN